MGNSDKKYPASKVQTYKKQTGSDKLTAKQNKRVKKTENKGK